MLIIKRILIAAMLALPLVGCDDSLTTDGSGAIYAASNNPTTYGNLYKSYSSKTSAYAEVSFSGFLGNTASGGNGLMIPIWMGCSSASGSCNSHLYICGLSHISSDGNDDPDIYVMGWYGNGTEDDTFTGSDATANVYASSDTSQKTFGCELTQSGGNYVIRAYLNGVQKASYVVGSSTNRGDSNKTVLDPGILGVSYSGRAGIGVVQQLTDQLKIHHFALYDKRPQ